LTLTSKDAEIRQEERDRILDVRWRGVRVARSSRDAPIIWIQLAA
jgi:hypothetical protein